MRLLAIIFGVLVLTWSGCSRADSLNSKEAVKAAIETHLQQQPNVVFSNLTLEVQDVKFSGDKAQAQATFRSKQSPQTSVGVSYQLHRVGDHWAVDLSTPTAAMGANSHGMGGTTQPSPATPQSSH